MRMGHPLLLLALSFALCSTLHHHATWSAMADCVEYTVKAGDICYDIAQAQGISLDDFYAWNPDVECSNLQIGQAVCVSDPNAPSPPPAGSCIEYTVKAGDICYDIAQAYDISLDDFYAWNPDVDCSNLQIGQAVCVSDPNGPSPPPPAPAGSCIEYTVKAGDICYNIAQASGISLDDFYAWNPDIDCSNLQVGQVVCVSRPGSAPPSPPPPPPSEYNGNVFMEYLGALFNGVTFSDVPINSNVDFYFILAFAIDYTATGDIAPTNGVFQIWWQNAVLTADAVKAIKAQYSNVKVMLSLGGDTVRNKSVLFKPTSTTTWVSNAVASLTSLINEYGLDGIDINYEHFATTPEVFTTCIGQLITELKNKRVISVVTIAPFDAVEDHYVELFKQYGNEIDYVNFQFYTYSISTSARQYVTFFNTAAAKYGGGSKMLASFNTARITGPLPDTVLSACQQLQASGQLPGIFVWSADNSRVVSPTFTYEQQAQALVAAASSTSSSSLSSFLK